MDPDLIIAAKTGNDAEVSALLLAGADVNEVDTEGNTALMLALNYPVISALLGAGADVNKANINGLTALIIAAANGHTAAVSALLLKAGADVNKAHKEV